MGSYLRYRDEELKKDAELIVKTGKSQRTLTRVLASLKGKGLVIRMAFI